MKQIKTIYERDAQFFDSEVNDALRRGWQLKRRYTDDNGYHADLEMEPGTCDDCRHHGTLLSEAPCNQCDGNYSKHEPLAHNAQWEEKENFLELEGPQ